MLNMPAAVRADLGRLHPETQDFLLSLWSMSPRERHRFVSFYRRNAQWLEPVWQEREARRDHELLWMDQWLYDHDPWVDDGASTEPDTSEDPQSERRTKAIGIATKRFLAEFVDTYKKSHGHAPDGDDLEKLKLASELIAQEVPGRKEMLGRFPVEDVSDCLPFTHGTGAYDPNDSDYDSRWHPGSRSAFRTVAQTSPAAIGAVRLPRHDKTPKRKGLDVDRRMEKLDDNDKRVLEHIRVNPMTFKKAIREATGLGHGFVTKAIERLKNAGLIAEHAESFRRETYTVR